MAIQIRHHLVFQILKILIWARIAKLMTLIKISSSWIGIRHGNISKRTMQINSTKTACPNRIIYSSSILMVLTRKVRISTTLMMAVVWIWMTNNRCNSIHNSRWIVSAWVQLRCNNISISRHIPRNTNTTINTMEATIEGVDHRSSW